MGQVFIGLVAQERERAEEIPWRGLAGAAVVALCLAAVISPPVISLLALVGWIR